MQHLLNVETIWHGMLEDGINEGPNYSCSSLGQDVEDGDDM